jgi:hypothetical protein
MLGNEPLLIEKEPSHDIKFGQKNVFNGKKEIL